MSSYNWWYFREYPFFDAEKHLEKFLTIEQTCNSWLRLARNALFLSSNQVSQKLRVSPQALCQIEKAEESGKITIAKLKEIAEAMDCELVYAIKPKSKEKFSQIVWKKLEEEAIAHCNSEKLSQVRLDRWRAGFAGELMGNAKVRKKRKWNRRKRISSTDLSKWHRRR